MHCAASFCWSHSAPVTHVSLYTVKWGRSPNDFMLLCLFLPTQCLFLPRIISVYMKKEAKSSIITANRALLDATVKGDYLAYASQLLRESHTLASYPTLQIFSIPCFCFGSHNGKVYSLTFGGNLIWEQQVGGEIFASPSPCQVAGLGDIFVTCSSSDTVVMLSASQGAVLASMQLPASIYSSPVVVCNSVFIGCRDDWLYRFNISLLLSKD